MRKLATAAAITLWVLACVLGIRDARADTKTVTWTNAVQNTDGTPIAATGPGSLVRTTIRYGTCNAAKTAVVTVTGDITVAEPATTMQLPLVVVQEFCLGAWHSNTFATVFAPSTNSTVVPGNSVLSTVIVTQSNPPQPLPPGGVTVGNFVAYQLVPADGNLTLLAFGIVRAGAACDMTHSVDDGHGPMYLIRDWRHDVTMPNGTPNTTRQTVFAACS